MRVGKRSDENGLERNVRPDHGFLIRIGKSDPSFVTRMGRLYHDFSVFPRTQEREMLIEGPDMIKNSQEPILTRNVRADKGFLTRVGKADKSFSPMTDMSTMSTQLLNRDNNQSKRQKSGSKAYFLTRVGRAGKTTKRKSYFTRIGRSSSSL